MACSTRPFARVEADPEPPLLPAHLVALDREARAVRLDDLQRLDVVAEDGAIAGGVVAALPRQVGRAVIVDAQHLGAVEVDHGAQALDRMGVGIVVLLGAVPAERMAEPPAGLVGQAVVAGRPGIDLDVLEIGDAALGERRAEPRIGAGDLADQRDVVDQDARPHAGDGPPVDDRVGHEMDPRLEDRAVGAVEGADERLAREGPTRLEAANDVLRRLAQGDGLEHHAGAEIVRRAHRRRGPPDLVRRQRIERVVGRRDRPGFGNGVWHAGSSTVGVEA